MRKTLSLLALSIACQAHADKNLSDPTTSSEIVFEEKDGLLVVEAEHFFKQEKKLRIKILFGLEKHSVLPVMIAVGKLLFVTVELWRPW